MQGGRHAGHVRNAAVPGRPHSVTVVHQRTPMKCTAARSRLTDRHAHHPAAPLYPAARQGPHRLPLRVRHWLGAPYTLSATELTIDMPLPGISPPVVLAEIVQKGFCALDVYGVVHAFEVSPPADFMEEIARDADVSATNPLRDASAPPRNLHG